MRKIPMRNYFLLGLVFVIVLVLCYLFYDKYTENKLDEAIMNRYVQVINYNEISNYVAENNNAFIYTSVLEDKDIRNFEIEFKNIINSYELNNKILYLDLTTIMKDTTLLSNADTRYHINNDKLSNVPNMMIFKDGELIEIFEIDVKNYDLNSLIDKFQEFDLIEDDVK